MRRDLITEAAHEALTNDPSLNLDDVVTFGMANWKVEGEQKDSPIDEKIFMQRGIATGGKTDGQALPARLVDFRPLPQGDVALLKVETGDLPSIELAGDSDVQIGTRVLSIGYPASTDRVTDATFEPTNKDGAISSKKTSGTVPAYETSAALSPGMSGGPTVGLDGRVLGINSFKPAGESQPFNFIAPATGLSELLRRNGVTPQLGPIDITYRNGLNNFYGAHYSAAIADFDKVLSLSPTHEQAAEYRTRAAKAREQFGDAVEPTTSSGNLLWYLVGGAALLLLLVVVGLVTFLLLRMRGRDRAAANRAQAAAYGAGFGPTATPGYGMNIPGPPGEVRPPGYGPPSPAYGNPSPGYGPTFGGPGRPGAPTGSAPVGPQTPGAGSGAGPGVLTATPPTGFARGPAAPGSGVGDHPATPPGGTANPRFCPDCGTPRSIGARFCAGCGTSLS